MTRPLTWRMALGFCMFLPMSLVAQSSPCADTLTTRSGIYSQQQATRGRNVYAGYCKSCHTPDSHTGATFNAFWSKRTLWDLFAFMREKMPKNEPSSLSDDEYLAVVAYILRMNGMPAGSRELSADSASLSTIRITPSRTP